MSKIATIIETNFGKNNLEFAYKNFSREEKRKYHSYINNRPAGKKSPFMWMVDRSFKEGVYSFREISNILDIDQEKVIEIYKSALKKIQRAILAKTESALFDEIQTSNMLPKSKKSKKCFLETNLDKESDKLISVSYTDKRKRRRTKQMKQKDFLKALETERKNNTKKNYQPSLPLFW